MTPYPEIRTSLARIAECYRHLADATARYCEEWEKLGSMSAMPILGGASANITDPNIRRATLPVHGRSKSPMRSRKWPRYQLHGNPEARDPADVIAGFCGQEEVTGQKFDYRVHPSECRGGIFERKPGCGQSSGSGSTRRSSRQKPSSKTAPGPFPNGTPDLMERSTTP